MELLKRPSFRIYFYHPDETIYNKLGNNLVQHKSYYTICLGLSEYLAQFKFCGEFQVKQFEGETDTIIKSIIPMDKIDGYRIEDGFEYFQETVPAGMNPKRQPTRYQKVLYERNGKALLAFPENIIRWSQVKMLYSYKLKSHPNKLLVKHLENVAWLCKRKVERANIKFNYPKDVLAQIAYIIGQLMISERDRIFPRIFMRYY